MNVLQTSEEEQLSVSDHVKQMTEYCANEADCVVYMKKRAQYFFYQRP